MHIPIHIDSMKAAEELSMICKQFPQDLYLRADAYCIDPKSTLGILAIMYSAKEQMTLDTGELPEADLERLQKALSPYKAK